MKNYKIWERKETLFLDNVRWVSTKYSVLYGKLNAAVRERLTR